MQKQMRQQEQDAWIYSRAHKQKIGRNKFRVEPVQTIVCLNIQHIGHNQ